MLTDILLSNGMRLFQARMSSFGPKIAFCLFDKPISVRFQSPWLLSLRSDRLMSYTCSFLCRAHEISKKSCSTKTEALNELKACLAFEAHQCHLSVWLSWWDTSIWQGLCKWVCLHEMRIRTYCGRCQIQTSCFGPAHSRSPVFWQICMLVTPPLEPREMLPFSVAGPTESICTDWSVCEQMRLTLRAHAGTIFRSI